MKILVVGATGFVGRALVPALSAAGHEVFAATRGKRAPAGKGIRSVRCDVEDAASVARAMKDVDAAFFLVHGMGKGRRDFARMEERVARDFATAAADAGLERLVYLGGVAPREAPSEHLKSRLDVGAILRGGKVPTLELRASMIIGPGSASWQIVRDLALRLPAMLLPAWTESRTCPIALEDAVEALVRGLEVPLPAGGAWYDIPGPDTLSGRELLLRIAALRGRRVPTIGVPFLSVSLSSWWLKLVTHADFSLARELVLGFTGDLLPRDRAYWGVVGYEPRWSFDEAAKRTLEAERTPISVRGIAGKLEESVVQLVSPKIDGDSASRLRRAPEVAAEALHHEKVNHRLSERVDEPR